ncbi:MAG: hypothetical protein JXR83_20640 [Deltaproteobacteria bacterium]|nr:hypothetical protein [Deltaproteobacteria bacterium]
MPRIAKADVHAALERAAKNISDAKTPDGIVSRNDIKDKLGELDGTEKKLTDIFYRFIDHRDHVAGARITQKDIDRAVAYAKEKIVDKYDLNRNGLSRDEIAKMSLTGKLAVELARELKKAAAVEGGTSATDQQALEFIKANADRSKLWHDLNGGNVGLHAYALDATDAALLIDVCKAFHYNPRLPEIQELNSFEFDPARHAVYGVLETDDESILSAVVVDKQTGQARRLGVSMNMVDVDVDDDVAKLVPGGVEDDYFDAFKGLYHLLKNGRDLLPETDRHWTIENYR